METLRGACVGEVSRHTSETCTVLIASSAGAIPGPTVRYRDLPFRPWHSRRVEYHIIEQGTVQ